MIGLAWRLLVRDLRSGELRLLFLGLVVAVAAVTAVAFFTDRVRLALEREAQQLMGGDLVLVADHPLPPSYREAAGERRLQQADTVTFPSMVMSAGRASLADIKAVSHLYPLRGKLSTSSRAGEAGSVVDGGPAPGEAWVDERLATALGVAAGSVLTVGSKSLRVAAILTQEPDRGIDFFSLAPRLMMHLDDIPATGLLQFGSRSRYRLLLAGSEPSVAAYRAWLEARLARGERIEDIRNARPEIRSALDRTQRFLGLASLLTVVLAAVAVALAARRYLQRHLDTCAIMRCLGTTQGQLLRLHALQFFGLALCAAAIGCLLGFAAHFVLIAGLANLLAIALPRPGVAPMWLGLGIAGILLFGFAFPPLLQLSRVPTLRVLRRELGPPRLRLMGGYSLGVLALLGLIVAVAGDVRLGALAAGGFAVAQVIFWGLARLAVRLLAGARGRNAGFGWRQGLASLGRHAESSGIQIAAMAIGMMAMLLLTVTQEQLLDAWQKSLPSDAPNRFVINIQPEQRQALADLLANAGIEAELAPMVRARLVRVNGHLVSAAAYPDDERAQRLVEREFNLSWRSALPPGNRVVSGRWFLPEESGRGLASVEEGLARTLGVQLGDELSFSVAGTEINVRVSNLRKLEWGSMRVNFFVMTPPGVIEHVPTSYITSFHLAEDRSSVGTDLVARFPNLTVIDVGAILSQFRTVIHEVGGAVRFVFVFTVLAGFVVLYAAMLSAFDERRYEMAVMRALGARQRQLQYTMLVELALAGSLAGLFAAVGAAILGQLIARQVFQMDMALPFVQLPIAALGGAAVMSGFGWWGLRRILLTPPLLVLRGSA